MATRGSARLLGRDDIGQLAVGKCADLFMIDSRRLELVGSCFDPKSVLGTVGVRGPVDYTVVHGRVTVAQGHLMTVDEGASGTGCRDLLPPISGPLKQDQHPPAWRVGADPFIFLLLRSPLRKLAPVFPHTLGKQLSAGGRRVGDGIGPWPRWWPGWCHPSGPPGNDRHLRNSPGYGPRSPASGPPRTLRKSTPAASFPATSACSDTIVHQRDLHRLLDGPNGLLGDEGVAHQSKGP